MTADLREKLIDKLGKLKAMAESADKIGNEAEAQAFADKFQRLMLEHKIDSTEVDLAQEEREQPVGEHRINYDEYPDVPLKRARSDWTIRLAHIVAKAHFCSTLSYSNSSRISFVGRKSDCLVAEYVFMTLYRALSQLAKHEHSKFAYEVYKRDGHCRNARGFKESFVIAFITRLAERYRLGREQALLGSCTALVRIDRAESAVKDWMKDHGVKTRKMVRRTLDVNHEGLRRGRAAADRVNLSGKAVAQGTTPVKGHLR